MPRIKKITPLLLQNLFKTNNIHDKPKKNLAQKLIQLSTFWNYGAGFYRSFGYFQRKCSKSEIFWEKIKKQKIGSNKG